MKSVYIAIPASDGMVVSDLVANLLCWTHDLRYRVVVDVKKALFPQDNARNTLVKEFKKTDFDLLWWIDNDIAPPKDALHRMVTILEERGDIDALSAVGFSMRGEKGEYFPYPVTLRSDKDGNYKVYYGNGIEEVDAVGGACVMVRRKVYEAIERPYEFVYHKDGTLKLTCDFRVWQKVKEEGFNLFVDFDLLCDHQRKCSILGVQNLMNKLSAK